jgi:hypothetical protein
MGTIASPWRYDARTPECAPVAHSATARDFAATANPPNSNGALPFAGGAPREPSPAHGADLTRGWSAVARGLLIGNCRTPLRGSPERWL